MPKSKDYAAFEFHPINRVLLKGDGYIPRRELLESMRKHGFWPGAAIKCVRKGRKFQIIEGHNRFIAAKALDIPFHFEAFTEDAMGAMDPISYSSTVKQWTLEDIVTARVRDGDSDLLDVLEYSEQTGIPISISLSLFYGSNGERNGYAAKLARQGKYKIRDRILPSVVRDIVGHVGKYVPWSSISGFVTAISAAIASEGFDPDRFKRKVAAHPELLTKCRSVLDYVDMIDHIYNSHSRDKVPLAFNVNETMRRSNGAAAIH